MLILLFNILLLISVLLIISFKMHKEGYARRQTHSVFCFQNTSVGKPSQKKKKRGGREVNFIMRANILFYLGSYSERDSHQRFSCSWVFLSSYFMLKAHSDFSSKVFALYVLCGIFYYSEHLTCSCSGSWSVGILYWQGRSCYHSCKIFQEFSSGLFKLKINFSLLKRTLLSIFFLATLNTALWTGASCVVGWLAATLAQVSRFASWIT